MSLRTINLWGLAHLRLRLLFARFRLVVCRGCGQLEDMQLWCPELTALDCSYCSSLADIGLASLVAGCPRLDTLSLSVCSRLTAPGLRCLQRLAGLRMLDLSYTDLQVHL